MAAEWVKMRAMLPRDPKTKRMARFLAEQPAFQQWLFPMATPAEAAASATCVAQQARTAIVTAGLLQVWAFAQERGIAVTDTLDVALRFVDFAELDALADVPCFGLAMEHAEWAKEDKAGERVIFPNLLEWLSLAKERSAPKDATAADRMRRLRHAAASHQIRGATLRVTKKVTVMRNTNVTAQPSDQIRTEKIYLIKGSLTKNPPGSEPGPRQRSRRARWTRTHGMPRRPN